MSQENVEIVRTLAEGFQTWQTDAAETDTPEEWLALVIEAEHAARLDEELVDVR